MRTLFTVFALSLTTLSCAAMEPMSEGRSLAIRDASSTFVVTWDGEYAVAWRNGVEVDRADAQTWNEALWSLDGPREGALSSPHFYDRILVYDEIVALDTCSWAAEMTPVNCGQNATCGCEGNGLAAR